MVSKIIHLLGNLKKKNLSNIVNDIKNIKIDNNEICNFINFKENDYNKNLIYRNKDSEIILICWDKNSKTKIHNHPKNGCIMKILQGNLIEEQYNSELEKLNICNYGVDEVSYIHDNLYLHKIINNNQRSISLHIYSPPCFYDE